LKQVIIDTDPGIDDAAAIFLALASPELSVEAITTIYGNGPVEACTANALRLLHAAGHTDIPVYKGAAKPLLRDPREGWAGPVHGGDALGNTDFPLPEIAPQEGHAALEIIRRVMSSPGDITVLALGRMTNIALALTLEPGLAQAVKEIIVMGGAVYVPGNVSQVASANLHEDPESASILYRSGAPLAQVGLDVCDNVTISQEQLDRIGKAGTPTTRLLSSATPHIQSYYRGRGYLGEGGGVRYNDVPAVAYAIDPGLFSIGDLYVEIETGSELTRGQTVADIRKGTGRPPNVKVCLEVDAPRLAQMFTDRVVGYS
jgi:inosine-uridine nucleoside N-ribohydrolase